MINIIREKIIGGCVRKEHVWKQVKTIGKYPEFSAQIDAVRILDATDSAHRSEWYISIDGAPFSWVQLDTFNNDGFRYRFQAVSGDFDHYSGEWNIFDDQETNSIKLSCAIKFELGIPVIEENCGDVLQEKFQQHIDALIEKHASVLMNGTVDERSFPRVPVGNRCTFGINERSIEAMVINFSRSGMAIVITKGMIGATEGGMVKLRFGAIRVTASIVFDSRYDLHRIRFAQSLDEVHAAALLAALTEKQKLSVEETVAIYDVVKAPVSTNPPRPHQAGILRT